MIDTILPLPASLAICAITLAYTPSNSKLRLLAGATIAIFNWTAAQSTISNWFPGFIGPEYILGWILASNNWLNLARVEYKPPAKGYEKPYDRLRWGIYQVFDTRWSVHPSQIPPFDPKRPQWVPSRQYFLLWKIWTMTWCGVLVYLMKRYAPLTFDDLSNVPAGFLYRITEMSYREMWLRVWYGFEIMVNSYCCLCLMHAVCGFLAVGLFKDDPAGWRPLHGSPWSALGMRGFYRTFWHHCMRKGFTTHAVFLVNDVLRMPRKNAISRYLIVVVSFLISGVYHAGLSPDLPWQCSMQQIPYQMKIVGAILIEDIVAMLWPRFAPRSFKLPSDTSGSVNGATPESTSSCVSEKAKPELRRRKERNSDRDYPKSPMPVTPTTSRPLKKAKLSFAWNTMFLYGAIYLWTAFYIVYANSTLVWSTNKCAIRHMWGDEMQEDYFESHGFNEPV